MKKVKYFFISIICIFIIFYLSFLFLLPRFDINKYKSDIQKVLKEQVDLTLDFNDAQIITTPLFGIGLKIDNISVNLSDNSVLFSAESLKTRIALPSIFLLTAKVSCLELEKPFINLEIANDKLKLIKLAEDVLNQGKEQKLEQVGQQDTKKSWFNPAWIRIKIPNIRLKDYELLVKDLNTAHYLKLIGEDLTVGYFNGKRLKLKTFAELYNDEQKNITASVNINTFLPPPAPALDEEDDPAERIDIPFINPVKMYREYDLKANLDTKLKIFNAKSGINSFGYLDIDNVSLKIGDIILPESYFKAKTYRQNIKIDTNIYPVKDQHIKLLGKLNYGKKPRMDMLIKTAEIKFNDLVILSKSLLDSLSIYNELSRVSATGSLVADCYIKTNFKKLRSYGNIIIANGGLDVKGIGKILSGANINVILDNNILEIKESGLSVGGAKIDVNGSINEKSVTDISINADKVPLPVLFNAFATKPIRQAYRLNSGDVTLNLALNGKLKNAVASLKFVLENLDFSDKKNTFRLKNTNFITDMSSDFGSIAGNIKNEGLYIELPKTKSSLALPVSEIEIADKNISIKENKVYFNDNSCIIYSGKISDYEKIKALNFDLNGDISADDIIKLIGKEFKSFINSKGMIPVRLKFEGDSKKQSLFMQALTNKDNYITPFNIDELKNKDTSVQTVIDFKGNRIKIKNTGIFLRNINIDEKGKETITYEPIADLDGTIEGNRINLIKIVLPKVLHGNIQAFAESNFEVSGKSYVFGELKAPRMRGGFELKNLTIPEILIDLRKAELRFRGHESDIILEDLILNGSDIQSRINFSILPSSVLNILNAEVKSRYFNLDKVLLVLERLMKYIPATSAAPQTNSQPADIPISINNGKIDFARIITGNINLNNTQSDISLLNNIFKLHNLKTNAFDGIVNGDIAVNILSMFLDIDLKGKKIDVDKAMRDACAMKDTLSGIADFNAIISLKGLTLEEQMQSLKGNVDFIVKEGQFGPFAKIENLILAENIRESQFFQTAIGSIISGLLTIDTTHFSELKGNLSFNDGICYLEPITSLGDILSLHIFGEFDLIKNYADMKVRARMASLVSNLLGPLGAINPANMINSAASLNIVTAKAFSFFCEMVPEDELELLPSFSNDYVDNAATKFQIVVRGDVAKPLTLVKSFKWLAGKVEFQNALDFVNSLPEQLENSTATTIEELIAEDEAYKRTLKYKFKKLFDEEKEQNEQTIYENPQTEEKDLSIENMTDTVLGTKENAQE